MRRKTEARRLSFVQAAGRLFISQGFGAVTMEAIATEAGASKVTLYSYFRSKDELFGAFAAEAGKGVIETLDISREEMELHASLRHLGVTYLNLVTRPEVVNLNRLIIGEAGRHPQLSRIFYENGPRQTLISICKVLDSLMQRGLLRRSELRRTGLYFKALCEAGLVERQLWGLDPPPSEKIREEAVDLAIEAFLPAYGVGAADISQQEMLKGKLWRSVTRNFPSRASCPEPYILLLCVRMSASAVIAVTRCCPIRIPSWCRKCNC